MIEARMNRRGLVLLAGVALLGGCKVIPKGADTTPAPEPAPTDSLPKDQARHRIALLVPLSGPNEALGNSIANATTMAILDTNAQTIRITTYDTASGPAAAASQAVKDGNKLILGPLLADDVGTVAAIARPARVPLITYSNEGSVASRDVFVMGHTVESSVSRVVRFAASKGVTRFAVLAPKGDYGARATAAYTVAVRAVGGTLVASESYDRGNNSIVSATARLKAKGSAQAVLIADSPRYAALAAPRLKSAGAAGPRILGTEMWSGDPLASSAPALRGAWFAAVSDTRFRQFSTSYKARFGVAPYRLATLGYDSVLLTVRIARDWRPGTVFPIGRLVDSGGFLGLDGPFRFAAGGNGDRALEVRETRAGGLTVISPAPEKFVD
ncbi:MAG TPA: penicillin-binding protein activator [Novosphingobium sp.]|nr:penicillin-binding protein activator [Novosphingobium sp.]